MSKFTGKSDLGDWFGMIACEEGETPFECYKRLGSRIFYDGLSDIKGQIKIEKPSDLVLFYPFIDVVHSSSKKGGYDNHYIARGSYLADVASYDSESAARRLQDLLDEYWRVKEEEDPKYVM